MILALKSSGLVHKYAQNRHDIGVAVLIGGQRDLNGISTPFNGKRTAPRRPRDGSSTSFDDTSRSFDVSRRCSPWRPPEEGQVAAVRPLAERYVHLRRSPLPSPPTSRWKC